MSVWPVIEPFGPSLAGSEGSLVSVSIDVDARHLESLLEALAHLSFPVNPEIYHDAVVVDCTGGREKAREATLVEFPAYEAQMAEVRRALASYGFDPSTVQVTGMLEEIREGAGGESPDRTAPAAGRRLKRRTTAC